jgi:Tfp pilus assembly protein PilV
LSIGACGVVLAFVRSMAPSRSTSEDGFSLIEVIVAAGIIGGAVITLAALCSASVGLMAAARYRSCALVLARAKLEEWIAAADVGQALLDGADAVDADGRVTGDGTAVYVRRWRFTAPVVHADRLIACEVDVTANTAAGLHVGTTSVIALLERQP